MGQADGGTTGAGGTTVRGGDWTAEDRAAIETAVADGFPAAVAALGRLVRIPSVSFPGFDPAEVRRSADAVAALLTSTGAFATVEVAVARDADGRPGNPAVVARRPAAPGRPTVLLYAHHDVQPAGRDEDWTSPPFEPTVRGDRLYGRGTSDDKGGVVTHAAAVAAAATALGDGLEAGIAVFVEGEEEAGSRSFAAFLAEHRDLLAADLIVVADSFNESVEVPSLTTSLRGNVTVALTVSTLGHASHSGGFGGAVPDAVTAAVRLLATLWDDEGAVAVEGLAVPPDPDAPAGPTSEELARDTALLPGVTEIGRGSVADRLWRGPAITVTGIDVPDVRSASNTLLPSVRARISLRVPPSLRAADAWAALRRHLEQHAPFGARLEFAEVDLGDPFVVAPGWATALAERALGAAFGAAPSHAGIGGSIPFLAQFGETFPDAQILLTGVEDPGTRAHSPDESQHLGVLRHAITAEALLLAALSRGTA